MKASERIIALLIALLNNPQKLQIDDILDNIPGYESPSRKSAVRKFESDKQILSELGIILKTTSPARNVFYYEIEGDTAEVSDFVKREGLRQLQISLTGDPYKN